MNVYIYAADMWCEPCARALMNDLECPGDPDHPGTFDSGDYPKGPFDAHQEESDTPNYCAGCQTFLENPLTDYGREYVLEAYHDRPDSEFTQMWVDYYEIDTRINVVLYEEYGNEVKPPDPVDSFEGLMMEIAYATVLGGPIRSLMLYDIDGRELDSFDFPCDVPKLERWFHAQKHDD